MSCSAWHMSILVSFVSWRFVQVGVFGHAMSCTISSCFKCLQPFWKPFCLQVLSMFLMRSTFFVLIYTPRSSMSWFVLVCCEVPFNPMRFFRYLLKPIFMSNMSITSHQLVCAEIHPLLVATNLLLINQFTTTIFFPQLQPSKPSIFLEILDLIWCPPWVTSWWIIPLSK